MRLGKLLVESLQQALLDHGWVEADAKQLSADFERELIDLQKKYVRKALKAA